MDPSMLKMFEIWDKIPQEKKEEINRILNNSNNIVSDIDPNIDLSNYKYHYINNRLNNIKDYSDVKSQSIDFFINKLKNNIKNIIILGLIQSGKTNEIIGIIHYCIVYLKIPIIVLIQNRTSGYHQLNERINNFNKELQNYNIKTRYVKTGLNKINSKKIFNYDNPQPEIIICLSNYKQLQKIVDNIKNVYVECKKIVPYVLIMDEYDDHIKTRQDETNIENYKIVEKSNKYLIEHSYINIGVTATLLACMLTDNNTKLNDIFQLKPGNNYVGYDSPKIKIVDIKEHITEHKNKRILDINKICCLLRQIENSVDYSNENFNYKDYSITLLNTTDNTKKHDCLFEEITNEFISWSTILFNSSKASNDSIKCSLPSELYYNNSLKEGISYPDVNKNKCYEIIKTTIVLNKNDEAFKYIQKDKAYVYRYTISFTNYSISEIITHLLTYYTNKICIISGRMACRGISFVTTDFKKHITDMIYVPSGSSHLTRNVQDMRIYGNFPNDNININLYTDRENYINNIGGYIYIQNQILNGELDEINNSDKTNREITLSQSIMNMEFKPSQIPNKKIDRINLVKGFRFKNEDRWGIPTNITNFDICYAYLSNRFKDHTIICYSKYIDLDLTNINNSIINGTFIEPTKDNKLSKIYAELFKKKFIDQIQQLAYSFNNNNKNSNYEINKFTQWYILNNYRNGWPLHNPLTNNKELIDICYKGYDKKYIRLILKNPIINRNYLNRYINTNNIIILFYSKKCFHYSKCERKSYYIEDNK